MKLQIGKYKYACYVFRFDKLGISINVGSTGTIFGHCDSYTKAFDTKRNRNICNEDMSENQSEIYLHCLISGLLL